MRQLRDDTHLILDGEVRVYRRERSKRWQAACSSTSKQSDQKHKARGDRLAAPLHCRVN